MGYVTSTALPSGAQPRRANAPLEVQAREGLQASCARMKLGPNKELVGSTLAVPWQPVIITACGATILGLALAPSSPEMTGLGMACLGVYFLSCGLWMAARRSRVIRRHERTDDQGMRTGNWES